MTRSSIALGAAIMLVAMHGVALAQGSGGVSSGPAFYVNGVTYRTVNTPTDLSRIGAPAHSFDTIYEFGGAQLNVATAAPGDVGYNGGRWRVHGLSFNSTYAAAVSSHDLDGDGVLDTNAEVWSALGDDGPGGITDVGVVKSFVCPVIRFNG